MRLRYVAQAVLVLLLCFVLAPAAHAASKDEVNGRLSGNWAGYVALKQRYTGVGATWMVPTVAASTTLMTDVTWVGIGGSKTRDLIQAGTHGVTQNDRVQYWAWYELLPAHQVTVPLKVSGGDKVSVSITEAARGLWVIGFTNHTTGLSHYEIKEYRSRYSSAEWIEELPVVYDKGGARLYAPLSEFDTAKFEDGWAIVSGQRLSIEDARGKAVTMVSRQNKRVVLATPSELMEEDTFVVARSSAIPSPYAYGSGKRNRAQAWEILWSRPE